MLGYGVWNWFSSVMASITVWCLPWCLMCLYSKAWLQLELWRRLHRLIWLITALKRSLPRLCFNTCLSVHGGCLGPDPGGGWGVWLEGVSRPRPRGSLGGCPDPHLGGCPGPGLGCVSQQTLRQTPPSADGYCCGRYASYWNAFSFCITSQSQVLSQYRVVIFNGNSSEICKNLFFLATSLHGNIYNIIHIYNLICYIDNIIIRIYRRRAF